MKEQIKIKLQKIRYSYVSFRAKLGRGMTLIDQFIQVIRYETYATWLTIGLNSAFHLDIPLDKVMLAVPFFVLVLFFLGYLDQHYLHIWQVENKYNTFTINPALEKKFDEVLKEIKNINEKLLGGRNEHNTDSKVVDNDDSDNLFGVKGGEDYKTSDDNSIEPFLKDMEYICQNCGEKRWKTIEKGKIYQCRNCGYIHREITEEIEIKQGCLKRLLIYIKNLIKNL